MNLRSDVKQLKIAAAQNTRERDFWLNQLAGELVKNNFHYDHKESAGGTAESNIDLVTFTFPGEVVLQLKEISKGDLYNINLVLITGIILLMHKYTGNNDITIGTPIYKQDSEGKFINTVLALRNRVEKEKKFKEFLLQVRQTINDAVDNQNYPIEILAKQLNGITADINSSFPLFDVAVLLENIHEKKYLRHINCNAIFSFRKEDQHIEGIVEYNSLLYEKTTVEAIIPHFMNLLQTAFLDPNARLQHIEMLTEKEKNQLLYDFNNTKVEYPNKKTIVQWFAEQVEKTSHHIAVSSPIDLNDSYDQLESETINPDLRQKMETLCFKKNSYVYQSPLPLPNKNENTHLNILKTRHHNSVIVNHHVAQLLDIFDGRRNLQVLYYWLKDLINTREIPVEFLIYSMRRCDLLEISFEFDNTPEVFSTDRVTNKFEDFVQLVKALYRHHLIELVGVEKKASILENPITNYFSRDEALKLKDTILLENLLIKDKEISNARVLLLGDTPGTATTGLLYLGSYLKRNGINAYCQFYDPVRDYTAMKENIEELLRKIQPAVVAISLKWFLYIARVLDMCHIIKEYARENSLDIKVVVGGNTASYYWEDTIKHDCIDYLIRGDGEEPLLKICRGEDEAGIPNCVYKKNGEIVENPITYIQDETNSQGIYLSHLEEILLSNHATRFGTFFIYTHKGCAMNCLYCGGCNRAQQKTFNRKHVFQRGVKEVRKDIMEVKKYTSTFHFEFDYPDKHLLDYCQQIWENIDLSGHFCIFSTLKLPHENLTRLVSQTFKYVYWDYDICTLSERHREQLFSLGLVKPQSSDKEILNFMAQCEKYQNIEVRLNLITGLPYFTLEDIEPGEQLLSKILNTYSCFGELHWARLHAQPGAPILENPRKHSMHSYASTFEDFLKYSQENFNPSSNYATVEDLNYPYIYFNDDQLNSRITNFYLETNKKIAQHIKDKKRGLIVSNTLTYEHLNEKAGQLAKVLNAKGVRPGKIVGLMLERSIEIAVGIFGILKAGCAYMPIDPEFPVGRIEYMLNDSDVVALVTTRNLTEEGEKVRSWEGEAILLEPGFCPGRGEVSSPAPNQAASNRQPEIAISSFSTSQVSPTNLAYVIYTSGTTGKPKGVLLSQENLVNYVNWFTTAVGLTQLDKTVLTSSFAFDLGYTSLFTSLLNGGELHILPRGIYLLGERLLDYIYQKRITYIKVTPSLFSVIVNSPNFSGKTCETLRVAAIGGEAINVEDIEKAHNICPHIRIMNHYGPTEATIGCVAAFIDYDKFEEYKKHPVIGKPIYNTSIYILGKDLNLLPIGVPGELCISDTCLASGYLNQPELTAEKFLSPSYLSYKSHMSYIYRSGDQARWLPGGVIEFLGRVDNQVKVRGYRIELGEIENRLLKHHQVKETVVVVKEVSAIEGAAENDDKFLCAYIVPQEGTVAPTTGSTAGAEKLLTLKDIREKENFDAPPDDYPPFKKEELNQSIIARFKKKVKEYPEKIAVKSNRSSLTYESLENDSTRVARKILEEYDDRYQLSKSERVRYKRQMLLYGWGMESQEKLKGTTVFVAGAGGGASPTIMQLALAGFGTIYVCDCDVVELSNLNRQFLHDESRIGMNKAISAKMTIERINPNVKVIPITQKLTPENVFQLVGDAKIIFDMFDGQQDKFVLSRCAAAKNIPHIVSAMTDINAYTAIFHPPETPCFHCLFDKKKLDEIIEGMSHFVEKYEKNPLPVAATSLFMSTGFAVNEAIKFILGFENPAYNKFIFFNQRGTEKLANTESYRAMTYTFSDHFRRICREQGFDWDIGWRGNLVEELKIESDPDCPVCGANAGEKPGSEAIPLHIDSDIKKPGKEEKDKRQTIALLLNHDIEMAVGITGALKSDKTYVLLEPHYPMERLIHILEASEARIILTDNQYREMAGKLRDRVNKNIKLININDINESNGTEESFTLKISPDKAAYLLVLPGTKQEENEYIEESHKDVLDFVRTYIYNLPTHSKQGLDPISSLGFYTAMMDLYATLLNGTGPYIFTSRHRHIHNKQEIGPGSLANELREFLLEELPQYMIPSHFVPVDHIPLTPNGKVDRKALPEPGVDTGDGTAPVAPRNEIEKKLGQIWSEVLRIEKNIIGIDSSFFHLGGNSLNATIMVAKIHKELNVKLPLGEIFKAPTIKELAGCINDAKVDTHVSIEPAEEKEYYPLSSAQKRLYILQQLGLENIAYNIYQIFQLEGTIKTGKFEKTFRQLIERHENLRTSFHMIADTPGQRVHKDVNFEVQWLYSSSSLSSPESIINHFIKPFDLSRAPLLRVGLIKLDNHRHLLAVDMHHIISDGVSHSILIKDFVSLYNSAPLPSLNLQYRDYSEWQQSQVVKAAIKQQEEYWLQEFTGEIPRLNLPMDYPRPAVQSFEGNTIHFELGEEETKAFNEIAQSQEGTLFMLLLVVYIILLSKVSNQEDIVVGTPSAGRRHADLEKIIGIFINMLPLKIHLKGENTFIQLIKELKEKTLAAFENQDYHYEDLIEKTAVERDMGRNPLFDAMFVLQNMFAAPEKSADTEMGKLKVKPLTFENTTSKVDLTLFVSEGERTLYFWFEYCTKLFKKETILGFIKYFKGIISKIIKNPETKISGIEIISTEEKKQILHEFNDTARKYPNDKVIPQIFAVQAEKTPDHTALVGNRQYAVSQDRVHLTYRELDKASDQLAHLFKEKGLRVDNIVGITVERSVEMVIGIFGILKAGGAYLPIDPKYPEERINYMLVDSEAKILVTTRGLSEKITFEKAIAYLEDYNGPPPSTEHRLTSTEHRATSLSYVIYTSGSTGKPKGVVVEQGSVVNLLNALAGYYPFGKADIYLLKTSYMFDVSVTELFGWFITGGRLAVLEVGGEKDPQVILDTVERTGITHINFVPSMFNAFVQVLNSQNISRLSSLKYIFLAGEALWPGLLEAFRRLAPHVLLENLYGPTEAAVYASRYALQQWNGSSSIPIGHPVGNVKLYILDNYGHWQPIGIPGELVISGAGIARGYLNRPELTNDKFLIINYKLKIKNENRAHETHKKHENETFNKKFLRMFLGTGAVFTKSAPGPRRQKIYKTSDLARWLPDGNIEFLGRIDHQVKVRGFRIELGEIETQLLKHEKIKESVVMERKSLGNENYLCAYIVLKEGKDVDHSVDISSLRAFLSRSLPDYMIPSQFVQIEKIPLNWSGKVDRKALESSGNALSTGIQFVEPKSEMERFITEIWKYLLKVDRIGIYDNFFDLGGNSLNILKLNTRLKMKLGTDIPVVEMFRYTTIHSLSTYLSQNENRKAFSDERISEAVNSMEETMQLLTGEEDE